MQPESATSTLTDLKPQISISEEDYKEWRLASHELRSALQSSSQFRELMWPGKSIKELPSDKYIRRVSKAWIQLGDILTKV